MMRMGEDRIFIARQYAMHAECDIVFPIPSVLPSVRPSNAGIVCMY